VRSFLASALALLLLKQAQAEPVDTLTVLLAELNARQGVDRTIVDRKNLAIVAVLSDGTEMTFYSDRLDLILSEVATDEAKKAAVREYVEAAWSAAYAKAVGVEGVDLSQLRPIVNIEGLYDDLFATNPQAGSLAQESLLQGLSVYFVVSASGSFSYINAKELEKWNVSFETASTVARENLRKIAKSARVVDLSQDPWVAMIVLDGIFEGGLLALPDFWIDLQSNHSGLGVIYPARGALFVFDSSDVRARSAAAKLVDENFANDPYPVSKQMLEWTDGKWIELEQ
jgi:hypothetical protein